MIEEPPLLTVSRIFNRPDPADVALFEEALTGHVVDSMTGRGALDPLIKPINPAQTQLCGVAVTVQAQPGDNLGVHAATDLVQPGDVVIVATDSYRETAVIGDLLGGMLKNGGAVGFVTDGHVRDLQGLLDLDMPIFAAGLNPNSPTGVGPGKAGLPIIVGGVAVSSGDLLIGDRDGVVVVPQASIKQTAARLAQVREIEAGVEAKVKAGLKQSAKYQAIKEKGLVSEV